MLSTQNLSIRTVLLTSVGVISLIIWGMITFITLREWNSYQGLKSASEAVDAVSSLSEATIELSLERSLTQVALNLDHPIANNIEKLLLNQREKSNTLFVEARAYLENISNKDSLGLVQRLDSYMADINALRQKVDPILAIPITSRLNTDIKNIPTKIKQNVLLLNNLGVDLRRLIRTAPKHVLAVDRIIQQAWAIREYGGRERTLFAIATAKQTPINLADLSYMLENDGRARQAWDELVSFKSDTLINDEIKKHINIVGETYFTKYENLRQTLLSEAQTGNYSVNFDTLFAQSEAALQTPIRLLNIAAEYNKNEISKAENNASFNLIIDVVIGLLAASIAYFVSHYIVVRVNRPLTNMTRAMERLSSQELDVEIQYTDRNDEIGSMAHAMQIFKENMLLSEKLKAEQKAEQEIKEKRQLTIENAIGSFENAASQTTETVLVAIKDVENIAEALKETAEETAAQSITVSNASINASNNAKSVASASGQLAASIDGITQKVDESKSMSKSAVADVENTMTRVKKLAETSDNIGHVIELISSIAEQTNLLALNATIEAARAGDAGKGFAVVASEVKSLASQTRLATEDIENQITEMQSASNLAVEAINSITEVISGMDEIASSIASSVEEQNKSTSEIAANINQASAGTENIAFEIKKVSSSAEKTGDASTQVYEASQSLNIQANNLRADIENFLNKIRAA